MPPPSARGNNRPWILLGALAVVALAIGGAWFAGLIPGSRPEPSPSPSARPSFAVGPPSATPLASPPAAPAGDGTRATIETTAGNIVMELYTESAPVASENFINLAEAGFYNGIIFHRTIPDFMIQGGDPDGTGGGGPGYEIRDDAVVGNYSRGQVAMARPANPDGSKIPDSQGSQFFILVVDRPELADGGYAIFGNVVEGMDVVDAIVGRETGANDRPFDPAVIQRVIIQRP
jgi:cyclophilin family peptidyl-prolyl cis-trans isomerase